jgi:hypothetical protein
MEMMTTSRFKGAHGFEGFIACFQSKSFLQLVRQKLSVLREISIALDTGITGNLGNLNTIINPITATNTV